MTSESDIVARLLLYMPKPKRYVISYSPTSSQSMLAKSLLSFEEPCMARRETHVDSDIFFPSKSMSRASCFLDSQVFYCPFLQHIMYSFVHSGFFHPSVLIPNSRICEYRTTYTQSHHNGDGH
jgi:hypothetical protein